MSDQDKPKHPGGRPSKYKPEFCEMLIEHMKEGLSFESFAGVVGTCKQTIYAWTKDFPEFLDAKSHGEALSQVFWEKIGRDNILNESFGKGASKSLNASAWIFNMKNRFGWRDKQPDETDVIVNNINSLPDDQLDARLEKLLGEKL